MGVTNNAPALELKGIRKSFSKVEVLHGVDFELRHGEVHAIVGENGAGKSTLANIIAGVCLKDSGEYYTNGKEAKVESTKDSIDLGISMIHQEFNLIPAFSVADNIYLNNETMKSIFIDEKHIMNKAKEILKEINLNVPINRIVRNLTVAQQQLVEIAKCLSVNSKIVIMDEPTAPLSIDETDRLFDLIKNLQQKGISIIYISHRLEEIFRISDRVTVLRDGEKVGTFETASINKQILISHMVGRDLKNMYRHELNSISDEPVLKVTNLNCKKKKLKNISFELKKGEILGFSGLVGAGRTELFECIFGLTPIETGTIEIYGNVVKKLDINQIIKRKIGYVPEDRKKHGVLTRLSVKDNLTLPFLKKCTRTGLISKKLEEDATNKIVKDLNIKRNSNNQRVMYLSGGNQQKIALGKWLTGEVDILILDEPTRGVDVGAKAEIYKIMSHICNAGISIVMISSEMPEIIGMSNRAIVMCEGRITGELNQEEITELELMRLAVLRETDKLA